MVGRVESYLRKRLNDKSNGLKMSRLDGSPIFSRFEKCFNVEKSSKL